MTYLMIEVAGSLKFNTWNISQSSHTLSPLQLVTPKTTASHIGNNSSQFSFVISKKGSNIQFQNPPESKDHI